MKAPRCAVGATLGTISVECACLIPSTLRAYSITAACMPRQMPSPAFCFRGAYFAARDLPSVPRSADGREGKDARRRIILDDRARARRGLFRVVSPGPAYPLERTMRPCGRSRWRCASAPLVTDKYLCFEAGAPSSGIVLVVDDFLVPSSALCAQKARAHRWSPIRCDAQRRPQGEHNHRTSTTPRCWSKSHRFQIIVSVAQDKYI